MRNDDSADEPVNIVGDSEDDIPSTTHTPQGAPGSGTQQYPPHLSALILEAIGEQREMGETYVGQGLHDVTGLTEFRLGQSFQSKEEAVLSVKDYSIRRGVEYKVMESDTCIDTTTPTRKIPNYNSPCHQDSPQRATTEYEPGSHSCPQITEWITTS
ncbi:hypothetical protein Ahy_B06g084808 [Arachis hypogaea]|uniref:Transposase MuDR plant domain-containing protein n=2 Tax=Arachis TaxID=3817 RepID=A0A444YSU2_ARAHY|nr:hypothetical protein Ahy_B06g084808 [Arachis hypogaea]